MAAAPDPEKQNQTQVAEPPIPGSRAPKPEAQPEGQSLPTGQDKSGVTSQAISIPKGSGTIKGMDESFSAQLSTGIATLTVPIALPSARGGAQPALSLAYSSSHGFGLAGVGWDVPVPFISRQTDRGIPRYDDGTDWHPNRDRFVFNGGQELVPICQVGSPTYGCTGRLQPGEALPIWAVAGTEYYRARVEGSFLRFFLAPNKKTWRVQSKGGVTMELGVPLDNTGYTGATEANPQDASEIYRWWLVRQYDTHGNANPSSGVPTPSNAVVYRYVQDGARAYLTDIYDTSPANSPASATLTDYAHHTRLYWQVRPDPTVSYRSGYRMEQRLRLQRVDVGSKEFAGSLTEFKRVRRYWLQYDDSFHVSLLKSVQVEGRCAPHEQNAPFEGTTTSCGTLPPMEFDYSHVKPSPDALGYEAFDETLQQLANSPKYSLNEGLTDLFDVNSDALPDVIVTAPAFFNGKHGLFLNGVAAGASNPLGLGFSASTIGVNPNGVPPGTDENILKLTNTNVSPFDLDGDGRANLVHMPIAKKYEVFSPVLTNGGWEWQGRSIATASQQDVKIDFTNENSKIRVLDVNFDGLVDVVVTTGTEVETFFSLGRYPGGDGQFGHAEWTGPGTATISNDPVTSCLPWSATPVQFSDPDIKLADMNGDGITDIVRVRSGDIRYWPGRGNGFWGTGKRDDCPASGYGQDRHVAMDTSPNYQVVQGDSLLLDDVNGDGLADLVEVRFNAVDIYLNVNGTGWTDRHIIFNTPPNPASIDRVRLVDIDGSGTRDVLWGDGYEYKYIDLQGGTRPWLLTGVKNGLGKQTTIAYSTSTAEMIAAEKTGAAWSSTMPTVAHVVKSVTESDGLGGVYTTEYTYADPAYDGQQREFRGFSRATAKRIGDANSPTDLSESRFLLGECLDEDASDGVDACALGQRWRDNPREALKGLPRLTEQYDEDGHYFSTSYVQYRLRGLYVGLDGRTVRHAYETGRTTMLHDTAVPVSASPTYLSKPAVERELVYPTGTAEPAAPDTYYPVPVRSTSGRADVASTAEVDVFGNRTAAMAMGCIGGAACPQPDETIQTHTVPGRPTGEPTGWLWRTVRSYVTGSQHAGNRNDTSTTYDTHGDPLQVTAQLWGTEQLDRFHEANLAVAPTPADASSDGTIVVGNREYDTLGNLTRESAPTGMAGDERCRDVDYDPLYAQLPTKETLYVAGCDSANPLMTSASYDRGFEVMAVALDMNTEPTTMEYDEFARLTRVLRPDPAGGPGAVPSLKISYYLPPDLGKPYSAILSEAQDGSDPTVAQYLQSVSLIDGMGRARAELAEADPTAGDGGDWIVSDFVDFDAKGAAQRKYLEHFYTGTFQQFPLSSAPSEPYGRQRYDAFGRAIATYDLDGTVTLVTSYHALSSEMQDAADLGPGPHQGTPATAITDGHGRAVSSVERFREDGMIVEREERISYLPTGEPEVLERRRVGTTAKVTRWIRYDSLGRMVLNVEPNTSKNFTTDTTVDATPQPNGLKAWRYAYNDQGDLVGTSDARGCGANFHYDAAGRLLAEDYSPCTSAHDAYTPTTSPDGYETLYLYDKTPTTLAAGREPPPGFSAGAGKGRLVAAWDRASASWNSYDARGRVTDEATQVAQPSPGVGFANRYAPRWYTRSHEFDAADRPTTSSTGATVPELLGAGNASNVDVAYTARGTLGSVSGSYGSLVTGVQRAADGLVNEIVYGDAAHTTTGFSYDNRRRLKSVQTYRGPPGSWSAPPSDYQPQPAPGPTNLPTFQLLLQDEDLSYDVVNNPVEIRDWRIPDEWPSGAKPVTRKIQYDDLYRVRRVDYQYTAGDDTWKSPFEAENSGDPDLQDDRRAQPSPHVSFDKRVLWQSYGFDWLGNTSASDDDAHGFYDRSLGSVSNNSAKPYQLESADSGAAGGSRTGSLATAYDDAGNLTELRLKRAGPCLPSGATCSQIFGYDWDEVGRLVRARRWDVSAAQVGAPGDPLPTTQDPNVALRYAYDAGDQRVLKSASDGAGAERHTVYIFDSLELRRARWTASGGPSDTIDYERTPLTEVAYLQANGVRLARLVYEPPNTDGLPRVPTIGTAHLHVFFELGDHLGSTGVVLDKATSELVERSTYEAFGATESDYRPDRWKSFREDYKFTGKEDDVEVGLTYFGARFMSAPLNRWASADPLAIHAIGGDPNVYAYVAGRPLQAVDPVGLSAVPSGVPQNAPPTNAPGCEGGGCGASPPPPPAPAAPPAPAPKSQPQPAPQQSAAGEALKAYSSHTTAQLEQSASTAIPFLQPIGQIDNAVKSLRTAAGAAQRGDLGEALAYGFQATPLGGQLAALGGKLGGSVYNLQHANTVGAGVGAALNLKRGIEETGFQIAGIFWLRGGAPRAQPGEGIALRPGELAAKGDWFGHHLFPQAEEFAPYWAEAGIDIEQFRVQVSENTHLQLHWKGDPRFGPGGYWNASWREYLSGERAAGRSITQQGLFTKLSEMVETVGLKYYSPL
ncbi:MAG: DUF2380 domain-containing protein [Myxococcales bacterium]|nr:DUF2380 domain-containing protein [Myxococcales bacterium]MCB9576581.1 DUF2380 domain-containing protein [Polyangiaceae bacterium]